MGGRGAVALKNIGVSATAGNSSFGQTRFFTQKELDDFNSRLSANSSNKEARDLFIKEFGKADKEYGMSYKNGKAISITEGDSGSVYINSRRGEGTIHNHPVTIGMTGLGLSRKDVESGYIKGESMISITTQFRGKTVKQSIKLGKNFDKTQNEFFENTLRRKVLINGYQTNNNSINKVQSKLFRTQDKWFSNIKNQKKYGFSYYSTLSK